jgi:predicted phosphoribosyltransferase
MGAVASGGVRVLNPEVVAALGHFAAIAIERVTVREKEELRRREEQYRGARPFPELEGRTVILVDDGLATGATMRAAARAVRARNPARLIIAVPVAPESSCDEMRSEADDVVCAFTPEPFFGVGQFYENFQQTTDDEVRELLARANIEGASA